MRIDWRVLTGPVLVIAAVVLLMAVDRGLLKLPNPSTVLLFAVALATYIAGLRGGMLGAAVALLFAALDYVLPGTLLNHGSSETAHHRDPGGRSAVDRGDDRRPAAQTDRSLARERARIAENTTLRLALDRVGYGVVLLDPEMRAQFINRAFRRVWRLPDAKADAKPAFVALMYHGRDTKAYADCARGDEPLCRRARQAVRAGDSAPIDIKLASSDVIRFQCTGLPDGGRMLSYVPVTDLFRHAEALETLATIDGLTGLYNRRCFLELAEAEWARFQRYHRPLSLIVADIDHFKSVNDGFGHDAGDAVLAVSRRCSPTTNAIPISSRGSAARNSCMLLPETELKDAHRNGGADPGENRRARAHVGGRAAAITVSAGVAQANASMSGFPALAEGCGRGALSGQAEGAQPGGRRLPHPDPTHLTRSQPKEEISRMSQTNRRASSRQAQLPCKRRIYYNGRHRAPIARSATSPRPGRGCPSRPPLSVPEVIELHIPQRRNATAPMYAGNAAARSGCRSTTPRSARSTALPSFRLSAASSVEERLRRLEYEVATLRRRLDEVQRNGV